MTTCLLLCLFFAGAVSSNMKQQEDINETFRQHLSELEHFVITEVEVEQLERWLIRATRLRQKKVSESEKTTAAASAAVKGAALSAAAAASTLAAAAEKSAARSNDDSFSQISNKSPATSNTNAHQSVSTSKNF